MIVDLFLKQRYKKALQNMSCGEYVLAIKQVDREINNVEIFREQIKKNSFFVCFAFLSYGFNMFISDLCGYLGTWSKTY